MSRPALRVIEGGSAGPGQTARPCPTAAPAAEHRTASEAVQRRATNARQRRGVVSAAIAAAGGWLVEPAETEPAADTGARSPAAPRAVVTVFGLAPGCGATVVARALAAELAARDASGTAAVACEARPAGIPLATQAASRLAGALEDLPGATTRAVGRLCLIEGADPLRLTECSRHLAPLVLDAGSASLGGTPAAVADRTVLVTTATVEPALARVAAECLARAGAESIIVLNRARPDVDREGDGPPGERRLGPTGGGLPPAPGNGLIDVRGGRPALPAADLLPLPDSRLGAQLALGGREARGGLGRAIACLADRCEGIAR